MKSMNVISRWLRFAWFAAALPLPALSQESTDIIVVKDVTIMAGQRARISLEIPPISIPAACWRQGSPRMPRNQAYKGEKGDDSTPLSGTFNLGIFEGTFFSEPLFETTKFWIQLCDDLCCLQSSQTATVYVDDGGTTGPPAPFEDAAELSEGWWFSDWFGSFNVDFFPWIFHSQHGWAFVFEESSAENIFFYDLGSLRWFFTASTQYPNMYSFTRNAWVFYFEDTFAPREFVDLQTGEFFSFE